jgi:hypothetical protein
MRARRLEGFMQLSRRTLLHLAEGAARGAAPRLGANLSLAAGALHRRLPRCVSSKTYEMCSPPQSYAASSAVPRRGKNREWAVGFATNSRDSAMFAVRSVDFEAMN